VQLQAGEYTISLSNTTDVALRHIDAYGPTERVLDITGGQRLEVSNCSFTWGSFAGVTLNFKSAPNGGLRGGILVDNHFYQTANGVYYVNQANQGQDESANSNDILFARNTLRDIDMVRGTGYSSDAVGIDMVRGTGYSSDAVDDDMVRGTGYSSDAVDDDMVRGTGYSSDAVDNDMVRGTGYSSDAVDDDVVRGTGYSSDAVAGMIDAQ
jgi:hypothetical protein